MFTDEVGVWRQKEDRTQLVIEWHDIYKAGGIVLDGITELYWHLQLDWSYGEYCEFSQLDEGFSKAMWQIGMRLAEESDWEERLLKLGREETIEFWKRTM